MILFNSKAVLLQTAVKTARWHCKIRHLSKFTAASRSSPVIAWHLVVADFLCTFCLHVGY